MRKILFPILALVLAVGLAIPIVVPVFASPSQINPATNTYSLSEEILPSSEITLKKGVTPSSPNKYHLGDTITYECTVENPPGNPYTNTYSLIEDILPNGTHVTLATGVVQAPGKSNTYYTTYVVALADINPVTKKVTNRLHATGTDSDGDDIDAETMKTSTILQPDIEVTKTADTEISKPDDTINYTIRVTNTGDCALNMTSVDDSLMGDLTIPNIYGDPFTVSPLGSGLYEEHVYSYTVPTSPADPLENTVTVWYEDEIGKAVTDTDIESVDMVHPDLEITKTGDTLSKVGDTVNYSFYIHNTGDCTLNRQSVIDTVLGNITSDFPATLGPGGDATIPESYVVLGTDPDPLVNNVTATYVVPDLGNLVIASDEHSVDLVHPSISCDKTAAPTSGGVGDTITYNITVTNTGDVDLDLVSVDDSLMGDLTIANSYGTPFTTSPLGVGLSESHDFTRDIVLGDYPGPIDNTVTFTYTVPDLGNVVECESFARVDLEKGNLRVFKYHDLDGDKVYEPGAPDNEYGMGGWHFTISGPIADAGNTNASGYLLFSDVPTGHYVVTETLQPDWVNTDPGVVPPYKKETDVVAGLTAEVIFGNWAPLGCLEICKFEDANVNGVWDPGEPWLEGWKFHITGPGYDAWWTTGDDGCIVLPNLVTGHYIVTETLKAGWYNTRPGGDPPYKQTADVAPGPCDRLEFGNREELRDIPPMVSTMNQWGIIAMISLFAGLLVWTVRRKQLAS